MPRKKIPIKILTLDTETYGMGGELRRIAIYDGQNVLFGYKFSDIYPMIEQYYNLNYSVHIYIHFLDFDARKIPEIFQSGTIDWDRTVLINQKYAKITCKHYTLHDSFKLLPESLENLTGKKGFNLTHAKMDLMEKVNQVYPNQYVDKSDFFMNCDADDPVYLEYLKYDVISLYDLIYKLMDVSGLCEEELVRCLSNASMSKKIFKQGYKGNQFITEGESKTDYELATCMGAWHSSTMIKDNVSNQNVSYYDIEKKIRESYFGGRTEVFKPHLKPLNTELFGFHYDVNSLYPYVMSCGNLFPIGFPKFYDVATIIKKNFNDWRENHSGLGFIKCKVFIPKQDIPPLPCKISNKLIFPTGYIIGSWTYVELEYAIKNCGVKVLEYLEMIHFSRTFHVFQNYVKFFYDMKKNAKMTVNKALEKFAKLMLNTAYGWLALGREDKTELHSIAKLEKYAERTIYINEKLEYLECKSIVNSESIQPQIAAYVTSYGRLVLLHQMRKQKKTGEVYYCDTDSIVTDVIMDTCDVDKYIIGKWDLEKKLLEGYFLQPKVYYEDYLEEDIEKVNIKFKGISRATQKEFNKSLYQRIYRKLCKETNELFLVEEKKEILRSLRYTQKNNIDWNTVEERDKYINLGLKQKRNIDYLKNKSEPWHMESIEMFQNFTFYDIPKYKENGNFLNPII